jgi:uncharacterized protein YbjQ (UPF0145 family)
VAKFSGPTLKAIEKLAGVPIDIIAPSHGLVWRRDPGRIVELYRKWAQLAQGGGEAGVTLVYGSMYGNTEKMMNAVAQGISRCGVPVEIFDAARVHPSYILPSLWTRNGVIVGAPTYEVSLFPPVAQALGTNLILPAHYPVANAVGTVVGNVMVRQEGEVMPYFEGLNGAGFYARAGDLQQRFAKFEAALAFARESLIQRVTAEAQAAGAATVAVDCRENLIWEGMVQLTAWAVGKPASGVPARG